MITQDTLSRGAESDPHSPSRNGAVAQTTLEGRMMHVSRLATIGEMAAGVAHELNQPLTAIVNYAQAGERLLRRPEPDLADLREALQEISSEALRAADIIRRLRSLVRNHETEREVCEINAVVAELMQLMQTEARAHDVQLQFDAGSALPPVRIDRVQIQHVLLNLMRNAMEALEEVPTGARELLVKTSLTPENDIEVCLCDSGPGVSARAADRMFDPFFTTKPSGTGLGLAISTTIMRDHEGKLGFRPNSPLGACFFLRIPSTRGDD